MEAEEMHVGDEVSTKEMDFVKGVIEEIRRSYKGPIEVVGSRKDALRISTKAFLASCHDLPREEFDHWQGVVNQIAREKDISAGEIRNVSQYLPEDAPEKVKKLFENPRTHVDSDLDLAINEPRSDIKANYYDDPPPKGSGLVIEIYEPGDTSYIDVNPYNY